MALTNQYISTGNSGLQSADFFQVVSPSNSVDLTYKSRAIYVGAPGDVSVQNSLGVPIVFVGLAAGAILPIVTSRVNLTGTTAANLVVLY